MKQFIFFLSYFFLYHPTYGCSCGHISIKHEADSAYDIIVGKITSEKENFVECEYIRKHRKLDWSSSYVYTLDIEYTFKEKLKGKVDFLGGKGQGDCGGIFELGKNYLVVVHKCDKAYFTYLCSDNSILSEAGYQLDFLNTRFNKNFGKLKLGFLIPLIILSLTFSLSSVLIVFKYYRYRSRRAKK